MRATSIRSLRRTLVEARRSGGSRGLEEITRGLRDLADSRYRCCLVDFQSCRPAFYVRVLGFEGARIKAELEFPIEPRLRTVQWLPLSHLADYDEAEDVESIREIYRDVSPYLKARTTNLKRRKASTGRAGRLRANGNGRLSRTVARSSGDRRRNRQRRGAASRALWWCVAGLLLTMLTLFAAV